MIDLYYWPTPNAHKITILLEELGLPYRLLTLDIQAGAQFDPQFLAISPNNRMPAIVDHDPADGGAPVSLFESGAILEYLADKAGRFLGATARDRYAVLQWLYWQMAGVGPMFGQAFHFRTYAPEPLPYAIDRYTLEVERLLSVLDEQLANRAHVAGDYSIADMAIYPWVLAVPKLGQDIETFPHVARWTAVLKARPAVERAYARAAEVRKPEPNEAARGVLFGQGRRRPAA